MRKEGGWISAGYSIEIIFEKSGMKVEGSSKIYFCPSPWNSQTNCLGLSLLNFSIALFAKNSKSSCVRKPALSWRIFGRFSLMVLRFITEKIYHNIEGCQDSVIILVDDISFIAGEVQAGSFIFHEECSWC